MKFSITKMKNAYGLCETDNGIENYTFESVKKSKFLMNVVYGINMSGKSSIVKVLRNLKDNAKISNLYTYDKMPEVMLNFDGEIVKYTQDSWENTANILDSIFIYDKSFLTNNINLIGETAYLGIGATPYFEAYEKRKELVIPNNDIRSSALSITNIKNKSDFQIKELGFYNLYSQRDCYNSLLNLYDDSIITAQIQVYNEKLLSENMHFFAIKAFNYETVDKLLKSVKEVIDEELKKYHIVSNEDILFYKYAIRYLDNEDVSHCPVCLKELSAEERIRIAGNISLKIDQLLEKDNINKIIELYDSIKDYASEYNDELKLFLKRIIEGDFDNNSEKEWIRLKQSYVYIIENLEKYAIKKIIELYDSNLKNHKDLSNRINELYLVNSSVTNSTLVNKFNELKEESMFPNVKDIKAILDKETKFVKINIKDTVKDTLISEYHKDHASEGEKSLLSILYFFAYIETNSVQKKYVFIDDPIDSNDNYNKHLINNFMYTHINKNNTLAIIFSHSIDIMRYYTLKYKSSTEFHFINVEYSKLIFKANNDTDLAIFKGLSEFFVEAIRKSSNAVFTAVALLPLLREFIKETLIFDNSLVERDEAEHIYFQICNKAMHFNPLEPPFSNKEILKIYEYILKTQFKKSALKFDGYDDLINQDVFTYLKNRSSSRKYFEFNVMENLMLKNLSVLYFRYLMEKVIYDYMIKKCIYDDSNILTIDFTKQLTLNDKIEFVNELESRDKEGWEKIKGFIRLNQITANEFQHLTNAYITPMLEMKLSFIRNSISRLEKIKDEII